MKVPDFMSDRTLRKDRLPFAEPARHAVKRFIRQLVGVRRAPNRKVREQSLAQLYIHASRAFAVWPEARQQMIERCLRQSGIFLESSGRAFKHFQ
jgi:hypothetical protein